MALIDTNLYVPLGAGLHTDLDDRLVLVDGSALELINAFSTTTGQIRKRYGSILMPGGAVTGGTSIPITWQLANYKGSLVSLSRVGAFPLCIYSQDASAWANNDNSNQAAMRAGVRGPIQFSRTPVETVDSGSVSYDTTDGVYIGTAVPDSYPYNGFNFTTYEVGTSVRMRVLDDKGRKLWETTVTNAKMPRVVVCAGYACFYYISTSATKLECRRINTATFAASTFIFTPTVLATAAARYDIFTDGTLVYAAVRDNASKLQRINFDPSIGASAFFEITTAAGASINSTIHAWVRDHSGAGLISIITNGSGGLSVQSGLGAAGGNPSNTYVLDASTASTALIGVAGHTISNNGTGEYVVAYSLAYTEATSPQIFNARTKVAIRNVGGGGILTSEWLRGVGLASRTIKYGSDYFALFSYESVTQSTYFLFRIPASNSDILSPPRAPLARVAVWNGAGQVARPGYISSFELDQFGNYVASFVKITRATQNYTGDLADTGVDLVAFSFDGTAGKPVEVADSLFVPGASPMCFDGTTASDFGFSMYPEPPTLTQTTSGGTGLSLGEYRYRCVYRYTAGNRVLRSKPSLVDVLGFSPGRITITTGHNAVSLRIPCARTSGWLVGQGITIEVYRTQVADPTENFKYVGSVLNDPTADAVTLLDGDSDLAQGVGELLYTTGGVIDNSPLPGISSWARHDQRLWGASTDNPREIWYSDTIPTDEFPKFNEGLILTLNDTAETPPVLAECNDELVVFRPDVIYQVVGEGPNALGQGATYDVRRIGEGIGTTNPQSIVTFKEGLVFRSTSKRAGYYMVDRGLSVEYIGKAVERYNNDQIVASVAIPEQSQLRFYSSSGRCLVFDLVSGMWSVFQYLFSGSIVAATSWNGAGVVALSSNQRMLEDTGASSYTDNGATYTYQVDSPWIQAAGPGGFQRVRWLQGMGKLVDTSNSNLTSTLYRDFDITSPASTDTFRPGVLWDWQQHPKIDTMSAFRVSLQERSAGPGPLINGFTVRVASKKGLRRVSPSNGPTSSS
jgi:hypothetical protein